MSNNIDENEWTDLSKIQKMRSRNLRGKDHNPKNNVAWEKEGHRVDRDKWSIENVPFVSLSLSIFSIFSSLNLCLIEYLS